MKLNPDFTHKLTQYLSWGVSSWGIWRRVVRRVSTNVLEDISPPSSGSKKSVQQKPASCLLADICWTDFFHPEDGGDMFHQKRRLKLDGLHGVISQKMILFITTAVKTSNPTIFIMSKNLPLNLSFYLHFRHVPSFQMTIAGSFNSKGDLRPLLCHLLAAVQCITRLLRGAICLKAKNDNYWWKRQVIKTGTDPFHYQYQLFCEINFP
jgi:hypothetical protein